MSPPPSLKELSLVFLRLGATAFGGPAAHIALMDDELVKRRKWLSEEEFLDLMGAANIIPGPTSTEVAIHIGYRQGGVGGLLLAGVSFTLPSALMAAGLAVTYMKLGHVPAWSGILYGVKPVVMAIIFQALWRLGRTVLKSWPLALLAVAAIGFRLYGVHELIILFGAGLLVLLASLNKSRGTVTGLCCIGSLGHASDTTTVPLKLGVGTAAAGAAAVMAAPSAAKLFFIFLKIGSVLFGSGYVLLAFLQADFVERTHWVTHQQLLDATAVGQVTPGPVSTTATFLGYLLAGPAGAMAATAGMFLPSFIFVWLSAPWIAALRRSPRAGRFLDGLNIASVALMAAVTLQLARSAVVDLPSAFLMLTSAVLLFGGWVSAAWITLGAAMIGLVIGITQS